MKNRYITVETNSKITLYVFYYCNRQCEWHRIGYIWAWYSNQIVFSNLQIITIIQAQENIATKINSLFPRTPFRQHVFRIYSTECHRCNKVSDHNNNVGII